MAQSTVLVTGANGYVAQTLVHQLLEKGYKVIGQVRSDAKGQQLSKLVNDANFSYVVVPVIEAKGAFDKVLQEHPEIETFYHTASPLSFSNENIEETILKPAINGTRYVLQSIKENAPQLKHFVYTSSAAAQMGQSFTEVVNEDSWSAYTYEEALSDGITGYCASKKLAEKEVWNFREQEKPAFTIATVLPNLVIGPQAYEGNIANITSSAALFTAVFKAKTREELDTLFPFPFGVDVRDVARAHIFAAEDPKGDGQRLSVSGGPFNADTVLAILNEKYPDKCSVKANDPPAPLAPQLIDNTRTQALLGEFITPVKSITDALDQFVKVGLA